MSKKSDLNTKKVKRKIRLRFLTIVMLIVIFMTGGINGYCVYNVFGRKIDSRNSNYDNMTQEQIEIQKLREDLNKEKDSERINYSLIENEKNIDNVIVNESDAFDVFLSVQSDLGIYNAQEEYSYSYMRSNDYYDVYTMQQYYDGIEVYGSELKMTADKSGNLLSVNGEHKNIDGFDTSVSLSEDDAYDYVEKYLKSEYQISTDNVSIDNLGKKIVFDDNNEPVITYLFEISDKSDRHPFRKIFLSGVNGEIISDNNLILYDMVRIDLKGQLNTHKNVDVWENYSIIETAWGNELENDQKRLLNPQYQLYDTDRNASIYQINVEDLTDENYDTPMQPVKINYGKDNDSAVDAFAYFQNVYDFYKELFQYIGLNGNGEEVSIYNNTQNAFDTSLIDNACYLTGTNNIYIGKKLNKTVTCSAYLDILAHEYTHAVVYNQSSLDNVQSNDDQKSSQFAIGEGLGDLFGELAEDYCHGKKLNNKCDWIHGDGDRIINNPSSSKSVQLTNADDFIEGTTDCHDGASIISHSAYLMTQGINGTEALTNEQLAKLYYYMLSQMDSNTDFTNFRYLVEQNALNMNKLAYSIGPLEMTDEKSCYLTDEQWESVVDAFDQVGIERSYLYSFTSDATLKVYDINNKPYSKYHMTITKANDNTEIVNKDFKNSEYKLPNLKHGVYNAVIYDLENVNLQETFTFIVNDTVDGQKSAAYETSGKILTTFGSIEKEVVLALDVSGSMQGTPLSKTQNAALQFVDTIFEVNPKTKINVITYSDYAVSTVSSSNDKNEICDAIRDLKSDGGTNMYDAVSYAKSILDETKTENKYFLIMSDGLPNRGENSNDNYNTPLYNLADEMKSLNITICTLGFFHELEGSDLSEGINLMNNIASDGYYYDARDVSEIQNVFNDIAKQVGGKTSSVIKIACPVDVTVSYNGEILSSSEDDLNKRTSFGTLSFSGEDNEIKILRLNEEADYEICINGTGKGKMDYSISFADENGDYTDTRTFENIPISKKSVICTNSKCAGSTMLNVDTNGDGKFDLNYIAGKNKSAEKYNKVVFFYAKIITGILLFIFIVIEILLIAKRYKINKYCSECKSKINRNASFCAECGNAVKRIPLILPEKIERKKQHKAVRIIKFSVVGICLILTIGITCIYRSAPNTVFLQLRDSEFISAKMLYYNADISDSWISKKYLSFVTDTYINRLRTAYENNIVDKNYAVSVFKEIKDMNMGETSNKAEEYIAIIE